VQNVELELVLVSRLWFVSGGYLPAHMGALLTVVEDHRFDSGLPWRLSEKLEPVVMMGGRWRISMSMWTGKAGG
jgi:hypothetical protein